MGTGKGRERGKQQEYWDNECEERGYSRNQRRHLRDKASVTGKGQGVSHYDFTGRGWESKRPTTSSTTTTTTTTTPEKKGRRCLLEIAQALS
jgi:hypothetical protein